MPEFQGKKGGIIILSGDENKHKVTWQVTQSTCSIISSIVQVLLVNI